MGRPYTSRALRVPSSRNWARVALRQQPDSRRAGEESRVMSRWTPGAAVASGLAPSPGAQPAVRVSHRFTAPRRGAGFWVALWTVAVAAEFGALVPILFAGDAPVAGSTWCIASSAARSRRAARRVAAAAGQPQRPADDRDRLRPLPLAAAQSGRVGAGAHDRGGARGLWAIAFAALILTFVSGGRLRPRSTG